MNNSSHDHSFRQDQVRPGERRTLMVIAITATMMVVEIAAGFIFGSMALLADGLHMASHAAALSIAAFAYFYARRHAFGHRYTFGTGKVNALAGFAGANLLAKPLIRLLRRAYPTACINVLVPPGRGGILEGNPDVNQVVEGVRKQGMRASIRFFRHIWRHYDLALSAPFSRRGSQCVNNGAIVQRLADCVGCDNNPRHLTRCMQELPPEAVTRAIDEIMHGDSASVFRIARESE